MSSRHAIVEAYPAPPARCRFGQPHVWIRRVDADVDECFKCGAVSDERDTYVLCTECEWVYPEPTTDVTEPCSNCGALAFVLAVEAPQEVPR